MPDLGATAAGRRWALGAGGELKATAVGGLWAVYNRASGETHIVSETAHAILDAVAEGPANAQEVLARVARDYDLESTDQPAAAIARRIAELDDLGLLVPVL